MYYPQWRRINKPIDRHHVLLDSLAKLVEGELFCIIVFNLFQMVGYGSHSSLVLRKLTNSTPQKGLSVQSVSLFEVQNLLGGFPFKTLFCPELLKPYLVGNQLKSAFQVKLNKHFIVCL
jgi:hypothetical protein